MTMPSKLAQYLAEQVRATQPKQAPNVTRSTEVLGLYKQGLQQLRGQRRNMHPDALRVETARLYSTTKAALDKLRKEQIKADQDAWPKLERKLWGHDGERAWATTTTDRASLDATIRDARERASQIKSGDAAAKALRQAEQSGDQILARAIGQRACDMDWNDVLGDYLSTRPQATEVYGEMCEIWARQNHADTRMRHSMQYAVSRPEELQGLSEQDIEAMTGEAADAA